MYNSNFVNKNKTKLVLQNEYAHKDELKMRKILLVLLGVIISQISFSQAETKHSKVKTLFHFVTVGDSREEPALVKLSTQEQLWIQNTKVLTRMVREIQAAKPQALFFNGDMIYGYSTDPKIMNTQYAYWRGATSHLMETGTYIVPVPGNHEVQIKAKDENGKPIKKAVVESEVLWRENMGDLIINPTRWEEVTKTKISAWDIKNTPAIGTDGITTDQSQLSYSFDVDQSHFAIFNTDPTGFDDSAPVAWLAEDFARAKSRGAKNFFVFSHKMAFTYNTEKQKSLNKIKAGGFDIRKEVRDTFWDIIEQYQAISFTGHQHTYHASQPRKAEGGRAWQVIVGSGGSNYAISKEMMDKPSDRMFSWADVKVKSNGKTEIKIFGFDEPFKKTQLIESWIVSN